MAVSLFIIEFVVVFFVTLATLHYYGNLRKNHFLVTLAVFVSWFFSFLIIFILPMDVTNTLYHDCLKHAAATIEPSHNVTNSTSNGTFHSTTTQTPLQFIPRECVKPWSHMPEYVLPDLWRCIYWSSQLLSWILLPIMQSYVYAGDFTVWGKIKCALYENLLWYGSYLVIFGALLIYVALKPELNLNFESLKLIGITASNTWGLLLLVFLMGYGFVDLPRNVWNMSKPSRRLENTLFRVAKLSTEKEDADEELSNLLKDIKVASEEIKYNNPLRQHLDVIIAKCPVGSETLFSKGTDDYVDYVVDDRMKFCTIQGLIKLHKNLIVISHRAARTQFQWNAVLKLAFYLEDVLKAESNKDHIFKSAFAEHASKSRLSMKMRWYWEIVFHNRILKLLALVLFVFSVAVVWSEVTFFSSDPTLSILALLIDVTKVDHMFFSIEIVSCLTIAYMCTCTFYTIFKMKFFNYYYFAGNHQTDANSLMFSGLLLCRLTYALCLNFLAMIHMDGHVTGKKDDTGETNFTRFMGHMDLLSFVAKGLNTYYPMVVLLVCFCTYFNLGNRLLHCFGVDQFIVDDDFSSDLVREGREIAKREKRKLERMINGAERSEVTKNIRNKYERFDRKKEFQRIDDSDDESMIDPGRSSPRTRIDIDLGARYSKDEEKLDLLSNVEYEPPPRRTPRDQIRGTSSSAPRNIFDDA